MQFPDDIRVLLVDDEDIVRQGFRLALERDERIQVVGETTTLAEAARVARSRRPDLIIVEAGIFAAATPDTFGAVQRRCGSTPAVVVITSINDDALFLHALRACASGYLLKRIKPDDLIRAVHAIAAGGAVISPEMTRRLIDGFDIRPPLERVPLAPESPLSARELDVLRRIAHGRSNREIAGELHLSETTVKSHVSRLLRKLGLRDRLQAASLVLWAAPPVDRAAARQ